jgi:hypothetical protein
VINATSFDVQQLPPTPKDTARSAARQTVESEGLPKKRLDEADPAAERNHADP